LPHVMAKHLNRRFCELGTGRDFGLSLDAGVLVQAAVASHEGKNARAEP
jgi:hypothetical protein